MKEYDYKKNKNIDLDTLKLSSNKKIWQRCNNGHEWCTIINSRRKGSGCPNCYRLKHSKKDGQNSL